MKAGKIKLYLTVPCDVGLRLQEGRQGREPEGDGSDTNQKCRAGEAPLAFQGSSVAFGVSTHCVFLFKMLA